MSSSFLNKILLNRAFVCGSLSALILSYSALASARNVSSLPFHESFDQDNYSDIVWVTQGATHRWEPNGWSGGAARFTPPNSEGYSGLGPITGFNNIGSFRRYNIRFLIKHGSAYHDGAGGNKLLISERVDASSGAKVGIRPMIFGKEPEGGAWRTWRPCHGTWCTPEVDQANEPFRLGPNDRNNEWISVEMETDIDQRVIRIYIHTADGAISGLYATNPFIDSGDSGAGVFGVIDILGGYFSRDIRGGDPNNFFIIDELVVDSRYIGPPAGFVGSTQTGSQAAPNPPGSIQ